MDARVTAVKVLVAVLKQKQHLDLALPHHVDDINDDRELALVRELCYGTMRWYFRLDVFLSHLLSRPLKTRDIDIKALLLCGLYQMMFLRIPDHAAVSTSVDTARKLGKPWAAQLVNAVLRRYQRERDLLEESLLEFRVTRYAHPDWYISKVESQWPDFWQSLLEANNQYPPLHIRINRLKINRENYLENLNQAGINASPARFADSGIEIHQPIAVDRLPGFSHGHVSVQDFGAQLVTPLLDLEPGMRVLDACAAPGGKTGQLAELCPALNTLVAVEIDADRTELLKETRTRLGFNAVIKNADVNRTVDWWDGTAFDRILLDAPCTASGVVRRHPDIKYTRVPAHIDKLVPTQRQMLETLWLLLNPGGKLLYVTCSVFNEENDEQIKQFTDTHDNVQVLPVTVEWGLATDYGRQTLPGHDDTDGFYCSILMKAPVL